MKSLYLVIKPNTMKNSFFLLVSILLMISCQEKQPDVVFNKYDETAKLKEQQNHQKKRMQFKLFQSKVLDMNTVFKPFEEDLAYFSEENYQELKAFIHKISGSAAFLALDELADAATIIENALHIYLSNEIQNQQNSPPITHKALPWRVVECFASRCSEKTPLSCQYQNRYLFQAQGKRYRSN